MNNYFQLLKFSEIKIASGETESEAIKCFGTPCALALPAAFDTCNISYIWGMTENGTDIIWYNEIKDTVGDPVLTQNIEASDSVSLDQNIFSSFQFLKLKCSVAQTDDRIVKVFFSPILNIN